MEVLIGDFGVADSFLTGKVAVRVLSLTGASVLENAAVSVPTTARSSL